MIWAGSPFAQLIEFSTGHPIGVVSYTLLGNSNQVLVERTLTPTLGDVSCQILIPGSQNFCSQPLFESRTLNYSYTTVDGLVSERVVYLVYRPLPFAASAEGVRSKLGVETHELRDDEIDLVTAYGEIITYGDASVHQTAGDRNSLLVIHAIEALAALQVLPTLQLKIASAETSSTSEYRRYSNVDWARIEAGLIAHVQRARQLLDPAFDEATATSFLFGKITPTPDVVTGS